MLRLGQIGAGIWGSNLLRNFRKINKAKVAACCDKDRRKLEKARSLYSDLETTTDIGDLLTKFDLDAVVIATPPSSHGALAELALENNMHVFVEKPLALNTVDAMRICKLAEKRKLTLMVGHLLLYHPAIALLKKIINSGELGKVLYIYSTRVNLGQVRLEENALWSLAPHDVSVVLHLLDEMPVEVATRGESYLQKGIEDVIFMSLKFKRKTLSNIHVSWLDPHKMRRFTIVGSKKMAVFDDMEPADKIKIYDKGVDRKTDYNYETFFSIREGDVHIPRIKLMEPLRIECQHFVDSVLNKKRPLTDGYNGLKVLSVLEAAQESLRRSGMPVKVRRNIR